MPGYVAPSSPSVTPLLTRTPPRHWADVNSRPSSGGLSKGAIGGIVAGSIVGGLIISVIIFFLVRKRRRRHRTGTGNRAGSDDPVEKHERGSEDDQEGEPKVEPYLGDGDVDLCEPHDLSPTTTNHAGNGASTMTTTSSGLGVASNNQSDRSRIPVGELERETKAMLGVQPMSTPTTSNTNTRSASNFSRLPTKSQSGPVNGPSRVSPARASSPPTTYTTRSSSPGIHPTGPVQSRLPVDTANPDSEREEVEYVRHTDGGGMRVELPPLYTDVPRREGRESAGL